MANVTVIMIMLVINTPVKKIVLRRVAKSVKCDPADLNYMSINIIDPLYLLNSFYNTNIKVLLTSLNLLGFIEN